MPARQVSPVEYQWHLGVIWLQHVGLKKEQYKQITQVIISQLIRNLAYYHGLNQCASLSNS